MHVAVFCIVLSFSALVSVNGQRPQPCVAPPVWTADFFQRIPSQRMRDFGRFYYDATNERMATYVKVDSSGESDEYIDILLYKERVGYLTDRNTMECRKVQLNDTFRPVHIPVNATFNGEFFLGTSAAAGAGVQVESWVGNTTNPDGLYEVLVTSEGCVLVNDFFYDVETGNLVETFFANIIYGIEDPGVFIPPDICQ